MPLHPEKKKKYSRIALVVGAIFLILGLFPGIIVWQLGLVVFIFSLVAAGVITIAIDSTDPEPSDEEIAEQERRLREGK